MKTVYETDNHSVNVPEKPHVSRTDGGHLIIIPKIPIEDRTKLSPSLAKELMKLTMIVGEAMNTVLNKNGVDIARINYQDNGNWKHILHIHIYGRAKSAIVQKWGHALHITPTPEEFAKQEKLEPLNSKDIEDLKVEIEKLINNEKYKSF